MLRRKPLPNTRFVRPVYPKPRGAGDGRMSSMRCKRPTGSSKNRHLLGDDRDASIGFSQ